MKRAIGFIELNSIAKGVETADIVLKTAAVRLLFSKASCPGKYYIFFTGDVAAVQASVDSGLVIAGDHAVDSCVIPNIDEKVGPSSLATSTFWSLCPITTSWAAMATCTCSHSVPA